MRDPRRLLAYNQRQRDEWVAKMAASLPAGTRVLDIGAGQTPYRSLFAHCDYKSQDFMQYEGNEASELAPETWNYGTIDYVSDVVDIPVEDASFDAVLCTEVLEHVYDPVAAIAEAARVVKPGGRLFYSAPLASHLHQEPHHYYGGFTPHFYRRAFADHGIRLDKIEGNGGFFRHLMQEIFRLPRLLDRSRHYKRWNPIVPFLYGLSVLVLPYWLTWLDEKLPLETYTVGFHVEGTKL
jgi:ubiquinone/menaquinone biosynthesis C-methylase UbiE